MNLKSSLPCQFEDVGGAAGGQGGPGARREFPFGEYFVVFGE
jgi:hypothetical protein